MHDPEPSAEDDAPTRLESSPLESPPTESRPPGEAIGDPYGDEVLPPCLVAPPLTADEATEALSSPLVDRVAFALGASVAVHAVAMMILAALTALFVIPESQLGMVTVFAWEPSAEQLEPILIEPRPLPAPGETVEDALPLEQDWVRQQLESPDLPELPSPLESALDRPMPAKTVVADTAPSPQVWVPRNRAAQGGSLEGRDAETRTRLVARHGGTPASEEAVAKALVWLAAHQRSDGGWRFDLRDGPCRGQCGNSGSQPSASGATALALLPFLGAGQTHRAGGYQEVVRRGLVHLLGRMRDAPEGGDWQDGSMYAHGLSAIVLCEAAALSGDRELRRPAQRAIDFIAYAQHPSGGWRYFPKQPGDATVFGWQMMALKSAQLAKLNVPPATIDRAYAWLDTVQSDGGASFGYQTPGRDPSPSAIGLLCRLYQGHSPDEPALLVGVERVARLGPQTDDLYFNYQATQLLHHAASPRWPEWNRRLRDRLVQDQARTGHESGSWYYADPHGMIAGRLYTTALATLILEVYYRHLPLYHAEAVTAANGR